MTRLEATSAAIHRFTLRIGGAVAWLLLAMVCIEFLVVILRYGLNIGSIAMQESVNYLHALCFLVGCSFALQRDEHVRVDIFYRNFPPQRKALVDLFGFVIFLLPAAVFIIWSSWGYVGQAWSIREASGDAGGLPGVFLLKTLIPVFALLLIIQGLACAIDSWLVLRPNPGNARD